MTIKEKLDAARQRQQQILDASRAAGNDKLTDDEQREFDGLQATINALSDVETDDTEVRAAAADDERKRINAINELGRSFGIDVSKFVDDPKATIDTARAGVLEVLKNKGTGIEARSFRMVDSAADRFRAAATDALILKSGGVNLEKVADGANELRGFSFRDLARKATIIDGKSADEVMRMDDEALLRSFYNPEASFPAILDNAIKKSIVEAYKAIPTTFDKWTSKGSLPDFKTIKDSNYVLGSFSEFKEVKENGELEHDTIPTMKLPERSLKTFGKSFTMTRKAFIDDDIGFVAALPAQYAKSAKLTIEKQVYSILANNPTIYDGKKLFHADHQNLIGSGAAPSVSTIQTAITTGREQLDPFGNNFFWTPKYIIVPLGYEFDLAVIFGSKNVPGSGNNDVNPLYNYGIEVIQVPMLGSLAGANARPWFIAADINTCGGIQVDYLNGQELPSMRRMEKPGTLGFQWDVWHDWGINVLDYRGLVKNPGETLS